MATDRFLEAMQWLWPIEGGWWPGKRASDPNPTMYGVTQDTYNGWRSSQRRPRQSVRLITREEATEIYRQNYWLGARCQIIWEAPTALVHFDAAVNHGVGNARKLLLRANRTWRGYIAARRAFYAAIIANNPKMKPNEKGWENRMKRLEKRCASMSP